MQYLSVRATEGLLTIAGIPFDKLEFTHDIDSLKDLCTSLVKFESTVDEWNIIRMDAEHYLFSLNAQACGPKMLLAIGDSLLDSLANFKAEPMEGELIINVIEKGMDGDVSLTIETAEIGGVIHIDHVHEAHYPREMKRPLGDAFGTEQLTLKMPWRTQITDIDVLTQLAKVHGVDNLGEMVSVSNGVPGNTRLSYFTLVADSLNDRYHGTYTVAIEWTGKRPQRQSIQHPRPEPVKENVNELLGEVIRRELTLSPAHSPSAAEIYAALLEAANVELPRMPLFMPVAWPKDIRDKPSEIQLHVSHEDIDYCGTVCVTIDWHHRARGLGIKRHISNLFNGNDGQAIKIVRRATITPHDVYYALAQQADGAMPNVLFMDTSWSIDADDDEIEVELVVSVDDPNYHGSLNVHIAWL